MKPEERDAHYCEASRHWVETVVVGLNLCPFAAREMAPGRLRVVCEGAAAMADQLQSLADQCQALLDGAHTTTLIVYPTGVDDFERFLDLIEFAEALLAELGLDAAIQLAHFHPHYRFEGEAAEDASNYTNRSPWPLLHLLRVEQVAAAVAAHPDAASIPSRNRDIARARGVDWFQARIEDCLNRVEK